jgi:hypothetical protein
MSNIYLGMDVHQRSITLAVPPAGAVAPTAVEQVPNEPSPTRPHRLGPRLHRDRPLPDPDQAHQTTRRRRRRVAGGLQ